MKFIVLQLFLLTALAQNLDQLDQKASQLGIRSGIEIEVDKPYLENLAQYIDFQDIKSRFNETNFPYDELENYAQENLIKKFGPLEAAKWPINKIKRQEKWDSLSNEQKFKLINLEALSTEDKTKFLYDQFIVSGDSIYHEYKYKNNIPADLKAVLSRLEYTMDDNLTEFRHTSENGHQGLKQSMQDLNTLTRHLQIGHILGNPDTYYKRDATYHIHISQNLDDIMDVISNDEVSALNRLYLFEFLSRGKDEFAIKINPNDETRNVVVFDESTSGNKGKADPKGIITQKGMGHFEIRNHFLPPEDELRYLINIFEQGADKEVFIYSKINDLIDERIVNVLAKYWPNTLLTTIKNIEDQLGDRAKFRVSDDVVAKAIETVSRDWKLEHYIDYPDAHRAATMYLSERLKSNKQVDSEFFKFYVENFSPIHSPDKVDEKINIVYEKAAQDSQLRPLMISLAKSPDTKNNIKDIILKNIGDDIQRKDLFEVLQSYNPSKGGNINELISDDFPNIKSAISQMILNGDLQDNPDLYEKFLLKFMIESENKQPFIDHTFDLAKNDFKWLERIRKNWTLGPKEITDVVFKRSIVNNLTDEKYLREVINSIEKGAPEYMQVLNDIPSIDNRLKHILVVNFPDMSKYQVQEFMELLDKKAILNKADVNWLKPLLVSNDSKIIEIAERLIVKADPKYKYQLVFSKAKQQTIKCYQTILNALTRYRHR